MASLRVSPSACFIFHSTCSDAISISSAASLFLLHVETNYFQIKEHFFKVLQTETFYCQFDRKCNRENVLLESIRIISGQIALQLLKLCFCTGNSISFNANRLFSSIKKSLSSEIEFAMHIPGEDKEHERVAKGTGRSDQHQQSAHHVVHLGSRRRELAPVLVTRNARRAQHSVVAHVARPVCLVHFLPTTIK